MTEENSELAQNTDAESQAFARRPLADQTGRADVRRNAIVSDDAQQRPSADSGLELRGDSIRNSRETESRTSNLSSSVAEAAHAGVQRRQEQPRRSVPNGNRAAVLFPEGDSGRYSDNWQFPADEALNASNQSDSENAWDIQPRSPHSATDGSSPVGSLPGIGTRDSLEAQDESD